MLEREAKRCTRAKTNAKGSLRVMFYTYPYIIRSNALCLQIPCSVRPDSRASNDDSDDCSVNVCDVYSESSSSVVGSKSSALPSKKKRARRVDEALLDYLSRPRPAENITEQVFQNTFFSLIQICVRFIQASGVRHVQKTKGN